MFKTQENNLSYNSIYSKIEPGKSSQTVIMTKVRPETRIIFILRKKLEENLWDRGDNACKEDIVQVEIQVTDWGLKNSATEKNGKQLPDRTGSRRHSSVSLSFRKIAFSADGELGWNGDILKLNKEVYSNNPVKIVPCPEIRSWVNRSEYIRD